MTKKHFIAIAESIKNLRTAHGDNVPAADLVFDLSAIFANASPYFDIRRFIDACTPDDQKD